MFMQFDISSTFIGVGLMVFIAGLTLTMNNYYPFSLPAMNKFVVGGKMEVVKVSFMSTFIMVLFCFVWMVNCVGMLPFCFSFSSHLWFSVWLSFSLFICCCFVWMVKSLAMFMSHLIPSGSPLVLGLILFWIELTSLLIRPMTLVLRLCANMLAGHVLLTLLASMFVVVCLNFVYVGVLGGLFLGLILFCFELFVCLIQALVFCLLAQSYYSEIG